ncbi:unnamed protein product [Orchesella dallaii]|uniref:Peptidase S1 domain-containing protein n=1 Tax=Orchesella dallaii TaxID=48710 RepID=A0ABP1Q3C2_9HEXA
MTIGMAIAFNARSNGLKLTPSSFYAFTIWVLHLNPVSQLRLSNRTASTKKQPIHLKTSSRTQIIMRLSNCLVLLCVFSSLNSALGIPKCNPEVCVPRGNTCKMMVAPLPFEKVTKKGPCEFKQDNDVYPGDHMAYCCGSASDYEDFIKVVNLKNQARALAGASPNEYPHQIKLQTLGGCGGTIYNKEWIITAAHCLGVDGAVYAEANGDLPGKPGQKAYVIAGMSHITNATDDNKYHIDKIIKHPYWNPNMISNGSDIALLHLSRSLPLEMGVIQPMRLEPANYIPKWGGKGFLVGYGNVHESLGKASDDLMEFVGPIHSNTKASALSMDPIGQSSDRTSPSWEQIGVGGEDSGLTVGQGDSGGPFICPDENNKPVLCGIASFKDCKAFKMCRKANLFTRLAPFLQWIRDETGNARQETELLFDKTMFPDQIPEPEVPGYLVRLGAPSKQCMGTLIAPKIVITTAECIVANGGDGKYAPHVHHIKTSKGYRPFASLTSDTFKRNISENVSTHMKQPLNKFDLGAVYLQEPIQTDYAQMAPRGHQLNGESDEYSFNDKTNYVERRHFVSAGDEDCNRRFRGVDENVQIDTTEQLCMRQVYSAEAVCERDLGGPLMCDGGKYLCGVKTFQACKYSGMPEIFESVFGPKNYETIDWMIRSAPK